MKGRFIMKNKFSKMMVLAFAATLLFAVAAQADSINSMTSVFKGAQYADFLSVTATDTGTGVNFLFQVDSEIFPNYSSLKVHDGNFFFFYVDHDIFSGALDATKGSYFQNYITGGTVTPLSSSVYNFSALYGDGGKFDSNGQIEFTLLYAGDYGWGDFVSLVEDYAPGLTVALHMQGIPPNGDSTKLTTGGWCDPTDPTSGCYVCDPNDPDCDPWRGCTPDELAMGFVDWNGECCDPADADAPCSGGQTPEPGTILLLGTGIVGLGFVARRKLTKK